MVAGLAALLQELDDEHADGNYFLFFRKTALLMAIIGGVAYALSL